METAFEDVKGRPEKACLLNSARENLPASKRGIS